MARRELATIPNDQRPIWYATISIRKVKPEMRDRLALYQKEAAKVLADHFLGRKKEEPEASVMGVLVKVMEGIAARLDRLENGHRRITDLITVEERCIQRGLALNPKARYRVRDVAMGIYTDRMGQRPFKLTGEKNGTIAFEREHLGILDQAIDIIVEQTERRIGGLPFADE